jgi:hypothetical protein
MDEPQPRPRAPSRRHGSRAARHRPRLLPPGEPGPRGGSRVRKGAPPDRRRLEPRTLRAVGLGHRPRTHLLVRFHVPAPRLRAARGVPLLRRGERDGSPGRPEPLRPRRPARLLAHLPRSITSSACAAPRASGSGSRPAPSS